MEFEPFALYIIATVLLWAVFRMKFITALMTVFTAWLLISFCTLIATNYEKKQFYGPGEIADSISYLAMPYAPTGDLASVAIYLDSKLVDNGGYSCNHVQRADGGPITMSTYSNHDESLSGVACCKHNFESAGWLVPYKVVGDKLHMLCGTFPNTQEVITALPESIKQ